MKSKADSAVVDISKKFEKSKEEEIQCLIENENFELVRIREIANETSILGSEFTDSIKAADNAIRYDSRLVAQN